MWTSLKFVRSGGEGGKVIGRGFKKQVQQVGLMWDEESLRRNRRFRVKPIVEGLPRKEFWE